MELALIIFQGKAYRKAIVLQEYFYFSKSEFLNQICFTLFTLIKYMKHILCEHNFSFLFISPKLKS